MKIYRYITFILLAALVWSCETPMLVVPDEVPRGIFVMYDPGNTSINSEDIAGTPVTGTFSVPADNVASHEVSVKRIYDDGDIIFFRNFFYKVMVIDTVYFFISDYQPLP